MPRSETRVSRDGACSSALGWRGLTLHSPACDASLVRQIRQPPAIRLLVSSQQHHGLLATDLTPEFLAPPELFAPTHPLELHTATWCLALGSALPKLQQRDPAGGKASAAGSILCSATLTPWHPRKFASHHLREGVSPDPPGRRPWGSLLFHSRPPELLFMLPGWGSSLFQLPSPPGLLQDTVLSGSFLVQKIRPDSWETSPPTSIISLLCPYLLSPHPSSTVPGSCWCVSCKPCSFLWGCSWSRGCHWPETVIIFLQISKSINQRQPAPQSSSSPWP